MVVGVSGASIGIIVPRVQAWTQTMVHKFTGLIGAAKSADAADPPPFHHSKPTPDRHQQDELMHISRDDAYNEKNVVALQRHLERKKKIEVEMVPFSGSSDFLYIFS